VIPGSGGSSSAWSVDKFDVPYPQRVRKGPFAKPWEPVEAPATTIGSAPSVGVSAGAIADADLTKQALARLDLLERDLTALEESNVLSEQSQELLVDEALPLVRELREVLTRIAADETERMGLVRASLIGIGKTAQTLSTIGRFSAGVAGLEKLPDIVRGGIDLLHSVAGHIG
jgi:hypothetical protein